MVNSCNSEEIYQMMDKYYNRYSVSIERYKSLAQDRITKLNTEMKEYFDSKSIDYKSTDNKEWINFTNSRIRFNMQLVCTEGSLKLITYVFNSQGLEVNRLNYGIYSENDLGEEFDKYIISTCFKLLLT